jgi:hypothetical protein
MSEDGVERRATMLPMGTIFANYAAFINRCREGFIIPTRFVILQDWASEVPGSAQSLSSGWPRHALGRGSALTVWPFEMASTYSRGVELGAIRIWHVVAANGSFRCCHQSLGRGDAGRSPGADLSERF